MSEARLADALARLDDHKNLHLPPRSRDLLGRLVLRFLWRRQVKWQVEVNLAARDAVTSLREIVAEQRAALAELTSRAAGDAKLATQEQLRVELETLRRSDQNMMAGMNQRLYSAIGGMRTELGELRLQLAEKAETSSEADDRLAAVEARLAELASAARDARLRHAQLDLFLDQLRAARAADTPVTEDAVTEVPNRADALELAVAELLDGPVEGTRRARAGYLTAVQAARGNGATGPVFDLAPGRGEWLESLRSAEVPARAASTNPFVVKHCAELGFQLDPTDPLDVLTRTARHSLGGVAAFRLVERLDPASVARLVDLAAQALQPGGVLIVETPNPESGAADFHLDPFARRPIHPAFLRFLAEAAGFATVEVRYPDGGPFSGWPAEMSAPVARQADRYCLLAWL